MTLLIKKLNVVITERGKEEAGHALYKGALLGDVVTMAAALSQGAEVNRRQPEEENRTPLMAAAIGVRHYKYRSIYLFILIKI